jgi:murein DD-endopeptidase MepM/ murein hydrolase activator NlpD
MDWRRNPISSHDMSIRRWMTTRALWHALVLLAGCNGDGGSVTEQGPAPVIDPAPASSNTAIPLFVRPFEKEYRVLNYFDHDRPVAPNDSNGYQLTWRGERAVPGRDIDGYDGHSGTDWLLPENTPVFAVTDSEVVFAGEDTFHCWLENRQVTNVSIILKFIPEDGETYLLLYTHLNRIDVEVGAAVAEGEQIGLSGATGCIGNPRLPHLHLELMRQVNTTPQQYFSIDPYGWEGSMPDPWSGSDPRKASYWFWKQGEAPDMVRP